MKKFKHFLAHLLGTNKGEVITYWDIDALYAAFLCHECGNIGDEKMVGVYHYDIKDNVMSREFKWHYTDESMPFGVRRSQFDLED